MLEQCIHREDLAFCRIPSRRESLMGHVHVNIYIYWPLKGNYSPWKQLIGRYGPVTSIFWVSQSACRHVLTVLGGGSARRKVSTQTAQHRHKRNAHNQAQRERERERERETERERLKHIFTVTVWKKTVYILYQHYNEIRRLNCLYGVTKTAILSVAC